MKTFDLSNYLDTMRILNETTEDSLYLLNLEDEILYFTSEIQKKFDLIPPSGEHYTLSEWERNVHERDVHIIRSEIALLLENDIHSYSRDYRLKSQNGTYTWINNRGKFHFDDSGKPIWMIGRLSDTVLEKRIDALTGLFNDLKMTEDLTLSLNEGKSGYLMMLGVDNLKNYNDKYGRVFGNEILKTVAEILEDVVDSKFRVYRFGGDRFAINLIGWSKKDVISLYLQIQQCLIPHCTASSGVAYYSGMSSLDANTIHQYAENAMYTAKNKGKNMQVFFTEDAYKEHLDLIVLQDEIQQSIQNNFHGFHLCYQPQMHSIDYTLRGAEALLRYTSPSRGPIALDELIPLLERTNLICEVGDWVLCTALEQCNLWRNYLSDFHMCVNISYVQLKKKNIVNRILSLLRKFNLPGNALTLELTESIQLQDFEFINKLFHKFKKHGIQISIDDFGTGYSSLSYLKHIAIDEVKIDKCFINRIQHNAYNYRLMSNIIDLAHSANIRICCEGIETEEELHAVISLHPDVLQGYLFAKPFSSSAFEQNCLVKASSLSFPEDSSYFPAEMEQEKLSTIIDEMEELVYVSDVDTYELLYMNGSSRKVTGIYDYKGKKCYEVIGNRTSPCENCQRCNSRSDDYNVWEINNTYLNRYLLIKDKIIPWQGKPALLSVGIDITKKEILSQQVKEKLDFEQHIVTCSKALIDEPNSDKALNHILKLLGDFYEADRAYIFKLQPNGLFWDNTHEWCGEGVTPQIDNLQDIPFQATERWMKRFYKGDAVIIEHLDHVRDHSPLEWEILDAQDIQNLIVAPIRKNREVVGFIGVDNPQKHIQITDHLMTISLLLADRLLKDETRGQLDDLLKLRYAKSLIFEYHLEYNEIELHTDMGELNQDLLSTYNFPESWISSGLVHPMYANDFRDLFRHTQENEESLHKIFYLKLSSGEYGWYKFRTRYLTNERTGQSSIVVFIDLVKREHAAEAGFARQNEFYRAILSETVAYAEIDLQTEYVMMAGGLWTRYAKENMIEFTYYNEFISIYLCEIVHPEDAPKASDFLSTKRLLQRASQNRITEKIHVRRKIDGEMRWVELVSHVFREQFTDNLYALVYEKDIDAEKKREMERHIAATYDPLTNVFNRRAFEHEVTVYMKEADSDGAGALLILDLDNFKEINDEHGHPVGDAVLKQLASILQNTFRKRDIIGRLGGDEFLIFLKGVTTEYEIQKCMEKLYKSLHAAEPFPIYGSVGITLLTKEIFDYNRCLREADIALYRSKNQGKDIYTIFKD